MEERQKGIRRSEVVFKIKDIVEYHLVNVDPRALPENITVHIACHILSEIEKCMLPKSRDANKKSSYGYARVYEWEDEGEYYET